MRACFFGDGLVVSFFSRELDATINGADGDAWEDGFEKAGHFRELGKVGGKSSGGKSKIKASSGCQESNA